MYAITAILTIVGFFIGFTIGATIKKVKTGKGYFRVIPLEEQPDLASMFVFHRIRILINMIRLSLRGNNSPSYETILT